MFVLGTAGHIDHGKSSLIKIMTGIDPDRLPEESRRGMTIDLGFAWLKLPDGNEIGIIDVPGHERFVRNMVAGAGGINATLLVIAADDGWMPQTQEHFDIIRLLNVKHGLVALTKIDLVDNDWRELVKTDIRSHLSGTFLENAPIIPVSSATGEGVDKIIAAVADIATRLQAVENIGKTRLFIDRSFVLTGIGVVVTGTTRGGGFNIHQDVYHFPGGRRVKIRSLESHGQEVNEVGPGSRVAINLSGMDRDEIRRGHVICNFPYRSASQAFAVEITNLPDAPITLKEGRRVLFILGTTETEASLRPFDADGLKPGQTGLAIVKTDDPLAAFIGDNFILRLPTPQVTVGGGRILDIMYFFPRRKQLPALQDILAKRNNSDLNDLILTELEKNKIIASESLLTYSNFSEEAISGNIDKLDKANKVYRHQNFLLDRASYNLMLKEAVACLTKIHRNKSYLKGLTAEELQQRLKWRHRESITKFFEYAVGVGTLGRRNQYYHLPGFEPALDEKMQRQAELMMVKLKEAGHNYLTFDDLEKIFKDSRQTINFLRDEGSLITIGNLFVILRTSLKDIMAFIEERLEGAGQVTIAEYRDRFENSRKYALPILEFLDQNGITRREGDYRIKGSRYDERSTL